MTNKKSLHKSAWLNSIKIFKRDIWMQYAKGAF